MTDPQEAGASAPAQCVLSLSAAERLAKQTLAAIHSETPGLRRTAALYGVSDA